LPEAGQPDQSIQVRLAVLIRQENDKFRLSYLELTFKTYFLTWFAAGDRWNDTERRRDEQSPRSVDHFGGHRVGDPPRQRSFKETAA